MSRNRSNNSTYQSLYLWTSFLLGVISLQLTGNSGVVLLSSWSLLFSLSVSAQPSNLKIIVPEFQVNDANNGIHYGPVVAAIAADEWVAAWYGNATGSQNIYAKRFAVNGSALSNDFLVNTANTNDHYRPSLANLNPQVWAIAWMGNPIANQQEIYAKLYAINGSVLQNEFLVNDAVPATTQYFSPVVLSLTSGEWVAAWKSNQASTNNWDIYARRYAINGSELGSVFTVNTNSTHDQTPPVLIDLNSSDWIVIWQSDQAGNNNIYAKRYALNGTRLGNEIQVNANATHDQINPTGISLVSGDWLIAWSGNSTGDYDIYAQRYAINGSRLGTEFRVNNNTRGNQFITSIASFMTGEWVIAWVGNSTGNYQIYAQCYAANGSVLGNEFLVNAASTNDYYNPTLTSFASGELVIAWIDNSTGNYDIYATIFSLIEPLRTTFSLSTSSSVSLQFTNPPGPTFSTSISTSTLSTTQSSGITSASTTSVIVEQPTSTSSPTVTVPLTTTQIPAEKTSGTTPNSTAAIAGGVAGGIVVLGGAITAYGFWRKKNKKEKLAVVSTNKTESSLNQNTNVSLNSIPRSSEYSSFQQDRTSIARSNYTKIDETKKTENEYNNIPKLEI
jgi:hypothetical protein